MRINDDQRLLHFETAILPDLQGLVWALAARVGTATIGTAPLADDDETFARLAATRFARSPRQRTFARKWADAKARRALAALRNAMRLAREVSEASPVPERLSRDLLEAMIATDRLGRVAAKAHRVLALITSLEKAPQ